MLLVLLEAHFETRLRQLKASRRASRVMGEFDCMERPIEAFDGEPKNWNYHRLIIFSLKFPSLLSKAIWIFSMKEIAIYWQAWITKVHRLNCSPSTQHPTFQMMLHFSFFVARTAQKRRFAISIFNEFYGERNIYYFQEDRTREITGRCNSSFCSMQSNRKKFLNESKHFLKCLFNFFSCAHLSRWIFRRVLS